MTGRRLWSAFALLLAFCAACAPAAQPFMRGGASGEQVQGDLEACTFEGRDRTAQAVPRADAYQVNVGSPEKGPSVLQTRLQAAAKSGAQAEYRVYVDEQVRAYVTACMKGKGYSESN